jgi:two-component system phosphate regulon response regulator PhoB
MATTKVLIIEDDAALADVLVYNFRQAGYEVVVARDGRQGLSEAQLHIPDIVLLDLMLPLIDGVEVCRRIRAEASTRDVLVLMLTAKSDETDQVIGFTIGADDYVTKPFSVKVLMERVKALLKRRTTNGESVQDVVSCQGITLDRRRHRVTLDDIPVNLTKSEFRLLDIFIRQPGRVFSRAELIDSALDSDGLVLERTIDVHIRSLRQKLGEFAAVIETVRGVGYRFRDPQTV